MVTELPTPLLHFDHCELRYPIFECEKENYSVLFKIIKKYLKIIMHINI